MPASCSVRSVSRVVDPAALSDEEAFDLKCIRYRNAELARLGCGDPGCALETCAIARHARLTLRALAALEAVTGVRTSSPVPKTP